MFDMIKVSAIITTHNRLPSLKRAVKSVLNQTYKNIELIVVDDHSTDRTIEWCLENNITVFQSPYKGGNVARNVGIKHACGDYVAFLDDDDYWHQNKIEKQVNIANSSRCDVIYCGIRKAIKYHNRLEYIDVYPKNINKGDVSHRIVQEIFTVTSALMIRRNLLYDVGLFDETLDFWQEYELCIRLAQRSYFDASDEILVDYLVDKSDKNRVTNKFYNWGKTVKLIHNKHRGIYSSLSPIEKIWAKRVEIWDAISRCENAGLKIQKQKNLLKLKMSFITERFLTFLTPQ